jgi:hypothetical protein
VNWNANLPATKIAGTYPIAGGTADKVHLYFNGRFNGAACDGGISEMTSTLSFDGGQWKTAASMSDAAAD